MTKVRMKDLAKELGVIYGDLAKQAREELGLDVKSPMSVLDEVDANRLRESLQSDSKKFSIEEKRVASRVIRRRRVDKPKEQVAEEPAEDVVAAHSEVEPEKTVEAVEVKEVSVEERAPKKKTANKAAKETKVTESVEAIAPVNEQPPQRKAFQTLTIGKQAEVKAPERARCSDYGYS